MNLAYQLQQMAEQSEEDLLRWISNDMELTEQIAESGVAPNERGRLLIRKAFCHLLGMAHTPDEAGTTLCKH